jgi:hypothetical protein
VTLCRICHGHVDGGRAHGGCRRERARRVRPR